ncbi:hypothetical protein ACQ86D_30850 [Streptomyces galilaeus]
MNRRRSVGMLLAGMTTIVAGSGLTGAGTAQAAPVKPAVVAAAARTTLFLWWNPARGDNFTTGTTAESQSALAAGYSLVRQEGRLLQTQDPGTVPLYLFWSGSREDNFSTATDAGIDSAFAAGYSLVRVEGYVYPV